MAKIIVQNTEITVLSQDDKDYISLTDMANGKQNLIVSGVCIRKATYNHFTLITILNMPGQHLTSNLCSLCLGETINTSTDTGESDALQVILFSQFHCCVVTRCQQLPFVIVSAIPYWSDGMNDLLAG